MSKRGGEISFIRISLAEYGAKNDKTCSRVVLVSSHACSASRVSMAGMRLWTCSTRVLGAYT